MAYLESIGIAVPKGILLKNQALQYASFLSNANKRVLNRIYSQSGVEKRHSVLLENGNQDILFQEATDENDLGPLLSTRMKFFKDFGGCLASESCSDAFNNSNYVPSDITHLICVSCTGFTAPGISCHLIEELGLSPCVSRVDIGFMGCHAAINAFNIANSIINADNLSKVLVVCTELCTLHGKYQPNAEQEVANSIFADGSAAAIIHGDEAKGRFFLDSFFSVILPNTKELMSWRIGDHSFEMGLSPKLPSLIEKELKNFLNEKIPYGFTLSDIKEYVVHPGGRKIIQAVESALSLPSNKLLYTKEVLNDYGNMSSATILFILKKLMNKELSSGSPVLMLAFGPGICIESALLFSD